MKQTSAKTAERMLLRQAGQSVKAKIINAGLSLRAVAKAARISQPQLSDLLSGRRVSRQTQLSVWDAYRRLAGETISLEDFWGALLSAGKEAK